MSWRTPVWLVVASALTCASSWSCDRPESEAGESPEPESSGEVAQDALPKLELKADTPNLLITWIDDSGEFHVGEGLSEVPEASQQHVRVVQVDQEAGTGKNVYVANLTQKAADGSYHVEVWPRSKWDELGAERREARMEEYAPPTASGEPLAASEVKAVVYGADWCKPCHQAEDLLKSLGVDVVKKDIETSPAAAAEMRQKLAAANRHGASIPVIDVAGKIFVGFNAGTLKKAVERARGMRF